MEATNIVPEPTPAQPENADVATKVVEEEIKDYEVPPEALNFEPPEDAVFFTFSNGDKHRRIFGEPQKFSQAEEAELVAFDNFLAKNGLELPPGFTLRDALKHIIVWNDYLKSYEGIIQQYEGLKAIRPVSTVGIEDILNSGMFYFCNRDKNFRPICILNLKKFVNMEFTDEELARFTVLMFDYVIDKCMIPGKIENFVVLLDARDVWATQIPHKRLKPLIGTMKTWYRGRLYKFFALHVSMTMRVLWKVVKGFMDETTQKQMVVFGGSYKKELLGKI